MFVMNTEDNIWPLRVLKGNKAPELGQGRGRVLTTLAWPLFRGGRRNSDGGAGTRF
jgi:hypothetical protein